MTQHYGLLLDGLCRSTIAKNEFDDWYDNQHISQRKHIEGVINTQRWRRADNSDVVVTTHDLESLAVLESPEYRNVYNNLSTRSDRILRNLEVICHFEAEQIVPGKQVSPEDAGGLLMTALNIAPEVEAEFNAWLDEEHLPRLLAVEGCISARRFKMTRGTHRYVAIYHLTSPDIQVGTAWTQAVETPWTAKMRPYFQNRLRLVLRRYESESS